MKASSNYVAIAFAFISRICILHCISKFYYLLSMRVLIAIIITAYENHSKKMLTISFLALLIATSTTACVDIIAAAL